METLSTIAIGAGLQDAFNPCVLMACAVFILYNIWISQHGFHPAGFRLLFILFYVCGTLFFNFSPISVLLFKKNFIFAAKVIYFILGMASFIIGVLFIKDWFQISKIPQGPQALKRSGVNSTGSLIIAVFSVLLLSALATLWPINSYVALLGMGGIVNGRWSQLAGFLMTYTLASLWPLWFLGAFLSIKKIRPALIKIVSAAVFLSASSSIIFIFK